MHPGDYQTRCPWHNLTELDLFKILLCASAARWTLNQTVIRKLKNQKLNRQNPNFEPQAHTINPTVAM